MLFSFWGGDLIKNKSHVECYKENESHIDAFSFPYPQEAGES
jgi:hypothetical protein